MSPASTFAHISELSRRSIIATFRQPQTWVPGFFFPIVLALVYSSQFDNAIQYPGFPEVNSFLDFVIPAAVLQGVSFGATNGASDLAIDVEHGFFDRLLLSPIRRVTILIGRMAGTAAWSLIQSIFLVLALLVFGAEIDGGFFAVVVLSLVSVLLGLFLGSMAMALALRSGSEEAVQSSFPLVFAFLFLSSAFFPTELMTGWYKRVAENNPVTFIIDPLRRMILDGVNFTDILQAVFVTGGLAVAAIAFALWQLQIKLKRSL